MAAKKKAVKKKYYAVQVEPSGNKWKFVLCNAAGTVTRDGGTSGYNRPDSADRGAKRALGVGATRIVLSHV